MRKLNLFLVIGIFITFLAHAIMGSLRLAGGDSEPLKMVARACAGLIFAHVIVTSILMCQTLRARRRSGAGYFKDNQLFWIRRISGLTILLPLAAHLAIFLTTNSGAYRLQAFTTDKLILQILLIAAIAFHVFVNLKPLLIGLGIKERRAVSVDMLLILSVLFLLFSAAFVIYYLRWISA